MGTIVESMNFNLANKPYILSEEVEYQIEPIINDEKIESVEIFNNHNPLNIEVGVGNGEFIEYYADKYKDENFMGFEIARSIFLKAKKRICKSNLTNVRLINYDGTFFIKLLKGEAVKNFFINFPDPWHKRRHKKRRILKPDFLKILVSKLERGGNLFIVTDHEDYAGEIVINLKTISNLKSVFESTYMDKVVDYYYTKYYRKFVLQKNIVFFFKLVKHEN